MTPFATKNAAKIRRIKLSENPENAFSGGRTPISTTATKAITDAVKMETASNKTPNMAIVKIVNKCQASGVIFQGMGSCQRTTPIINTMMRFIQYVFLMILIWPFIYFKPFCFFKSIMVIYDKFLPYQCGKIHEIRNWEIV
jgi:hypothetical protein